MKKSVAAFLSLTLSAAILAGCASTPAKSDAPAPAAKPAAEAKVLQVGLTQIVEHPALDAVRKGVIDGLRQAGFEDGKQIKVDFQTAQGEMPIAQQIAQKFIADKKDIVIAIATPSAQAAVQAAAGKTPVIFSAVTDPVSAQLVTAMEKPGANVTGVSDMVPAKDQLKLFAQMWPKAKRVGMIYNAGEANSVFTVNQAKAAAKELGLTIVEATVAGANEVQQAAQSLVGRVDGFYLSTDNTLAQGVASVAAVANDKKLPTFASETSFTAGGALFAAGFDYYQIGRQTGIIAARVLKGEKAGEIPVELAKEMKLMVNTKTMETTGIAIPADILNKAEKVVK